MKIGVVGAGQVGATAALMMAQKELGDIVLVDIVEGMPQGKSLDMAEAAPVELYDSKLCGSNEMCALEGADVVVVTSGVPRKPGMTREDLLGINAKIADSVGKDIAKYAPDSMILMVANPLDVLCQIAFETSGFPKNRVFGQAGILDSARFRCFIGEEVGVSIADIQAMVLGGHGDAMVPLISYTTVAGIPVEQLLPKAKLDKIVQRTRDGGAEIVKLLKTGSAYYAPGAAVAQMVDAIVKDKKRILPCSALCEGEFGIKGTYAGVPVKLGAGGVEQILKIKLTPEEKKALKNSAAIVQKNVDLWHEMQAKSCCCS